ncbi:hypothetical protein DL93DRAFT_2088481 [Clavulina sp. PMI_390]|nr:hypothetical protein DL93DRAFT_2088481 [Clavulina sp. PMI_390]
MFLMLGKFKSSVNWTKAGGSMGILTAANAYYVAASGIVSASSSYISLPVGDLPKAY